MRNINSLSLLFIGMFGSAFAEAPAEKADLHWARKVAVDFLEASTSRFPSGVYGLFSPELATALGKDEKLLKELAAGYSEHRIVAEEMSPNGGEAVFRGVLKGAKDRGFTDVQFCLRLVKTSPHDQWRIRFISIRERERRLSPRTRK